MLKTINWSESFVCSLGELTLKGGKGRIMLGMVIISVSGNYLMTLMILKVSCQLSPFCCWLLRWNRNKRFARFHLLADRFSNLPKCPSSELEELKNIKKSIGLLFMLLFFGVTLKMRLGILNVTIIWNVNCSTIQIIPITIL